MSYLYDAAGRRTQVGGSLAATGFPNAVSSAAYDVANEMTGWNGTTIGYDANGNISNDGVASYTWNGRNQLISRGATSFQYDSFGRRTLNAAGNSFLYEGWNVAQELSGSTPVTNQIVGGTDEFFSTKSGATYSPITDGLGSVLALTNSSGAIKTQYGYDPFGNTTIAGASSTNVFQYTGRENDSTGLYFYRARYYNPSLQRFISEDALGFGGGDANLYGYVANNPVNFDDPSGLKVIYLPGVIPPNQTVQEILKRIDNLNGDKDVIVISGGRTPESNANAGGAPNSGHLTGNAADIYVPGQSSEQTAAQAAAAGAGGIGTYDTNNHTHLDDRQCEWNGHNGKTLPQTPAWRPNPWEPNPIAPTSGRKDSNPWNPCPKR